MVVPHERGGNVTTTSRYSNARSVFWLGLVGLPLLALVSGCNEPVHVEDSWNALGQPFRGEVWMASEADAREAFAEMRKNVEAVEASMGYGVEGSLLEHLNANAADDYVRIEDRDFYRVLTLALDYAQFSHGAYDPTVAPLDRLYSRETRRVPTPREIEIVLDSVGWGKVTRAPEGRAVRFRHPGVELNLDTVTRGFALDAASRVFARTGSRAGLLRLGASAVAWQSPPGEQAWSVRIEDPRSPGRTLFHLNVANRCLAASGRPPTDVAGILDPRTGTPSSSDLLAAVALADSAGDANALSAALFVLGSHASGDLLGRMHRAEAVLLLEGNGEPSLLVSASLAGRIDLSPELNAEIEGRVRFILPPQKIEVELP